MKIHQLKFSEDFKFMMSRVIAYVHEVEHFNGMHSNPLVMRAYAIALIAQLEGATQAEVADDVS